MGIRDRRRSNSLGMLILNIVLICAIIVNGTYAWIHIGQSVNSALLYINEEHEVILEKYEKDPEGNIVVDQDGNPIPMEGVGFALYFESGEQLGGIEYTDEDGKIYVTVPVGNFYFEEIYYPDGFGPDVDENGDNIYRYEFTITGESTASSEEIDTEEILSIEEVEDEEVAAITESSLDVENSPEEEAGTSLDADMDLEEVDELEELEELEEVESDIYYVVVYNRPLETSLDVEKVVENLDGSKLTDEQLEQEFEFTVIIGDENTYNYYIENLDGSSISETNNTDKVEDSDDLLLASEYVEQVEDNIYSTSLSNILSYTYSNTFDIEYSGTITNGDKIYLKHGQVAVIEDIPMETYYQVTETRLSNYYTSTENVTGNITYGTNKAKFINIYDDENGRLRVTKEVQGEEFDPEMEFEFTATIGEGESQKIFTFMLKDRETHILEGIPVGTAYKVTETDYIDEKYYASILSYEGVLMDAHEIELAFINVYDPEEQPGDLVIHKEVITEDELDSNTELDANTDLLSTLTEEILTDESLGEADEELLDELLEDGSVGETVDESVEEPNNETVDDSSDKELVDVSDEELEELLFHFEVVYDDPDNPGEQIVHEFSLAHGEFEVLKDIPFGTNYVVREVDSNGYLPDYDEVSGYIVGKKYDDSFTFEEQDLQIVTFYNRIPDLRELKVTKMVTGDVLDVDKGKEFEFSLVVDGIEEIFFLKDGESEVFELPIYSEYEVTESDYTSEGFIQSQSDNSFGVIYQDLTEVLFVNEYVNEKLDIEGVKTWDTSFEAMEFIPESIIVHLKMRNQGDGEDTIVDSVEVFPEGGSWKYAFQVSKDNAYGIPYEYYVEEAEITNFQPIYDPANYDIYNQYVQETIVDLPTVEKQIDGISTTNTKFTFVLKSIDNAAMPTGVVGGETVRMLYGAGETVFGSIKYTEAGVYKYTITEVNDGLDDWLYDETIYNYEVVVELVDNKLVASPNLNNGEVLVPRAIFVNEYIGEDVVDPEDEGDDEDDLGATHMYVEGTKTWDHGLNSSEHQPSKLVVYILGDGEVYQAIETSASKNWSYKFGVPKRNEDGEEIKYTIGEEPVDGYNGVAIGYDLYNTFDLSSLVEPDSPQTSDYSQIWIWVWGLVASTITFVYVNRRKRVLRHTRRW